MECGRTCPDVYESALAAVDECRLCCESGGLLPLTGSVIPLLHRRLLAPGSIVPTLPASRAAAGLVPEFDSVCRLHLVWPGESAALRDRCGLSRLLLAIRR